MTGDVPMLSVEGLTIEIRSDGRISTVVDDVSFSISPGEFVGLAGESGSGKSLTALAILRLLPRLATARGRVQFDGVDLLHAPQRKLRSIRGNEISMVFQEPLTSLHPALTIGYQIEEAIRTHETVSRKQARERAVELLDRVGIPAAPMRAQQYPYEFSGGMLQRAMVAMALSCRPKLLIADEPTTALDVTVQAQLMDLLASLHEEFGLAVLLISHDLGLMAGRAERLLVMYAGQVVEGGPTATVFAKPASPYTEALLASIPNPDRKGERLHAIPGSVPVDPGRVTGCRFANRCSYRAAACEKESISLAAVAANHSVRCRRWSELHLENKWAVPVPPSPSTAIANSGMPLLEATDLSKVFHFSRRGGLFERRQDLVAVENVSLTVSAGETFGIVGESGSGKSTLARLLLRLLPPTKGKVVFEGVDLSTLDDSGLRTTRSRLQAVFQNVSSGLNHRMTLAGIVGEPLADHHGVRGEANRGRVAELLEMVGLNRSFLDRYPYELSGGQHQRVGLARAMASEPRMIILDEPASSLDVSTQSQVINLLEELQEKTGITYILIAHDLHLVHHICHRIAVMYLGKIVEIGDADRILRAPRHPYTSALIDSIPTPVPGIGPSTAKIRGEIPGPANLPSGCRFRTRCRHAWDLCAAIEPPLTPAEEGGSVACHLHSAGNRLPDSFRRSGGC